MSRSQWLLQTDSEKEVRIVSIEKKYHDLLDKLADAIENGKKSNLIEKIKEQIEKAEKQIHKNFERKSKK